MTDFVCPQCREIYQREDPIRGECAACGRCGICAPSSEEFDDWTRCEECHKANIRHRILRWGKDAGYELTPELLKLVDLDHLIPALDAQP